MTTLSQLRLHDWYSFRMEMSRYCRKHLLKRWKEVKAKHYVYFIFDQEPTSAHVRPVYIGCTSSLYWRLVKHSRKIAGASWVYFKEFTSKEEALRYEKRSIKLWKPRLNIKYSDWWQLDLLE
ncbi:GIY-YIG nuclease family protein (plasmid) [Adhaeribacter swui]|uniref:GIY-YIG nuclease family protein n=1 Tax=Adhaeribacter swui TaxID=2086471 RepID=A0A7G7G2I0_9BACT|nr:GIY-YIG nuclease family protein [Adhaeribacter swui]QNF31364.1 GIY-YIG nuclease family protein [Adhaeribacter swui]